ncbi:MAG: amidohydrolase family protein [Candidatus Korobacteraceae bacterium]|jgi:2,3-dihydroxybenzoate decarboxylase
MNISKITLEEHVALPGTVDQTPDRFEPQAWLKTSRALVDIHGQLLSDMDAAGVEISVLSLNSPGVQAIPDRKKAVEVAQRSNDYMAEQVAKNPTRFQAFAAVPMQDPEAASRELVRCVKELGFRGVLVNSFSQIDAEDSAVYLDRPQFWDFWATVEGLDVPLYLHPRDPLASQTTFLEDHPWLRGSTWGFTLDTATHALRLMGSGLFDKYPKLTVILGHLGETLPFLIWRIDNRIGKSPRGCPAKRKLDEYFRNNFYVTTSGQFCTQSLLNTMAWLGADRILFSVDYPFEKMSDATDWFDNVKATMAISDTDWVKLARGNAEKLLKLGTAKQTAASV